MKPLLPILRTDKPPLLRMMWLMGVAWLGASQPPGVRAEVDFYRDVYPVLKANCISCHNKTTHKASLNMETPELMKKGGDSGAGVVPGKGVESRIWQAAAHKGELVMPPKGNKTGAVKLTSKELALLKSWIDQGAKASVQQARTVAWQALPVEVNPIYAVSLTAEGRFAACSRANQIYVYDLATRQLGARLTDDTGLGKRSGVPGAGTAHLGMVQSLSFSPDGTRLASGSFREVKIWRREKPQSLDRPADPALRAVAAILTPDGRQIICGDSQGGVRVLDAQRGTVVRGIPNVTGAGIKLLGVSADSTRVAVYGDDGGLSVWNLTDGKRLASKAGLSGVTAVVWVKEGQALALAGADRVARVWTLPANGGEWLAPQELTGAAGAITALLPGAKPDQLLIGSEDGKVRLWNLTEGKVIREFAIAGCVALGRSRDGKQFAAGCGDGVVRVWDLESGKQVVELRGDEETARQQAALEWLVAGQALELTFQNREVARIDAENKVLEDRIKKATDTIATSKKELPEKLTALQTAKAGRVTAQKAVDDVAALIAKAPNAKPDAALEKQRKDAQDKLVEAMKVEATAQSGVSSVENHGKDAEVEVKNFTEAKAKNTIDLAKAKMAVETAQKTQAKASADLAALRQAATKENLRPLAVAFSVEGHSVAATFTNGTRRAWAVASGAPLHQGIGPEKATSLVPRAEGGFMACTAAGAVSVLNPAVVWVLERVLGGGKADSPFVDRVNAVRFSPDGAWLAAGGGEPSRSGDISLWEVGSGKLLKTWNERHTDAVLSLDFSPDGKLLASGGADKVARITEVESGRQVLLFEGHTHHVMGVSFRADGRLLASAGADSTVIIWNMLSGERKLKIAGWAKEVTSLQFIGATSQILTSAGDNLVRIVNDDGGEVRALAKLPDFMQAAASTATANLIVGGGQDSVLRVWDGTNSKELVVFKAN